MRRSLLVFSFAVLSLLAGCELEDDLRIEADGSGTYRARVLVEKLLGAVLTRVRGEAEAKGFRIVEEGETPTRHFVVLRKDFTDVRSLDDEQSSYDLTIETRRFFWREYRLRATLGSVAGSAFDRRFTISMPARISSTTAGESNGTRVVWYCTNGGTIEVVAEGFHVPVTRRHVTVAIAIAALVLALVALFRRWASARPEEEENVCTTCNKPMAVTARYCPSCGDRALQRPRGLP